MARADQDVEAQALDGSQGPDSQGPDSQRPDSQGPGTGTEVSGRELFDRAIRRHVIVIAACTLLIALAGLLVGLRVGGQYEATASVLLHPLRGNPYTTEDRGDDLANLETEAQLVNTDAVIDLARDRLGTTHTPDQIRTLVSVDVPTNTQVLEITYTANSPEQAQAGAEVFAETYLNYRGQRAREAIDNQLGGLDSQRASVQEQFDETSTELSGTGIAAGRRTYLEERLSALAGQLATLETEHSVLAATDLEPGQILSPPRRPEASSGPPVAVFAAAGAVGGLLLGLAIAVIRARTDRRVREPIDLAQLGLAPLATVSAAERARVPTVWRASAEEGSARLPAAYRTLRTRVLATGQQPPTVLGIVTDRPDTAWAPEASALAAGLSRSGFTVALVDTRGDVTRVADAPGLADLLTGPAQLVDLIHPVSATLGVLQVGTNATSVDDRLLSHRMRTLVADLRARCDFVLIAGPAGTSPEGRALAALTEATIVVVTGGEATRTQLVELKADLHSVGGDVLGAVLVEPEPRR